LIAKSPVVAEVLVATGFRVEPPIGIEPMTYALRECSGALVAAKGTYELQVHRLLLLATVGW
jgi:hypothetical protein